jgi:class 3 adenylate cyclase
MKYQKENLPDPPGLKAGIGIHTGIAVTGNLGSLYENSIQ